MNEYKVQGKGLADGHFIFKGIVVSHYYDVFQNVAYYNSTRSIPQLIQALKICTG